MVFTADKGLALVIIDKGMHSRNCMALFSDEEVYKEYRHETKSIHSKVLKLLLDPKRSNWPNFKKQYIKLHAGDNNLLARFYSLPKMHKVNIPIRPIAAACGTFT